MTNTPDLQTLMNSKTQHVITIIHGLFAIQITDFGGLGRRMDCYVAQPEQ
jgi:hypothetical protein